MEVKLYNEGYSDVDN